MNTTCTAETHATLGGISSTHSASVQCRQLDVRNDRNGSVQRGLEKVDVHVLSNKVAMPRQPAGPNHPHVKFKKQLDLVPDLTPLPPWGHSGQQGLLYPMTHHIAILAQACAILSHRCFSLGAKHHASFTPGSCRWAPNSCPGSFSTISILDQGRSFGKIWNHLGPFRTMWDHLEPFGVHLSPLGTTWERTHGPLGSQPGPYGSLQLPKPMSQFGPIQSHGPCPKWS